MKIYGSVESSDVKCMRNKIRLKAIKILFFFLLLEIKNYLNLIKIDLEYFFLFLGVYRYYLRKISLDVYDLRLFLSLFVLLRILH